MAYLVVELNLSQRQIQELNDRVANSGDKGDAANGAINLLTALACGAEQGSIQVTSRATTAGVTTDADPKSTQVSYTS